MHILVPSLLDTGWIADSDRIPYQCAMDYIGGDLIELSPNKVVELSWRKFSSPCRQTDTFIYVLKAWVINGQRKIVLRARRIRENGTVGRDYLVFKRVNGKAIF